GTGDGGHAHRHRPWGAAMRSLNTPDLTVGNPGLQASDTTVGNPGFRASDTAVGNPGLRASDTAVGNPGLRAPRGLLRRWLPLVALVALVGCAGPPQGDASPAATGDPATDS